MKTILLLICFSTLVVATTYSQNSEVPTLEKFRKENYELAKQNNELTAAYSKLQRQLIAIQNENTHLTQQIVELNKLVSNLRRELDRVRNELKRKNEELGKYKERLRLAENKQNQKSVQDLLERTQADVEKRTAKRQLDSVITELTNSEKKNKELEDLIKEKNSSLNQLDSAFLIMQSQGRDYIHTKEREIGFGDNIFKYGDVIFKLKFKEADDKFAPTEEERTKIKRLVELVSRYDTDVKIELIIGSKKDDTEFRTTREIAVKKYFFSFPDPFNLNDKFFTKKPKKTTENYDIDVTIVRR